jgi:hypothetical protein
MNELEASPPYAATLWDEQELSKRTGIAPSTLQKQRMRGDGIPFVKVGRMVRYRPQDCAAFFAQRVVHSTSEPVAA